MRREDASQLLEDLSSFHFILHGRLMEISCHRVCALPVTFFARRAVTATPARTLPVPSQASFPCVPCIFLAVSSSHDVWGETRRFNFRGQMCQVSILHCNGLYQPQHRKSLRLERRERMFDYFCILFGSLHHGSSWTSILQMTFQMFRICYYDSSSHIEIQPQLLNLHLR